MLNVSKGEGELARARVGRGQGLRLTLDLNSNWVSHGTLPSDKQANTFSNIKYIVVGGGYLSKYLLFVLKKNQAALVVLGGPRDFPSLRVSNLLVAPGRETWVEVHKIKSDTKAIKMKLLTFVLANLMFNYETS